MKHSLAGGDWKSRQLIKKGKRSQTEGKTKGGTCQTDSVERFFLTHPHAHRLNPRQYSEWHNKAKDWNK